MIATDERNMAADPLPADAAQPPAPGLWSRLSQFGFSVTDQALSVGGMFVANVALARTVSKEEYGMFALSYSVYTFLAGLHNAAILETYTIYGAGRYHDRKREYSWLIWRSNALLCCGLTVLLLLAWKLTALTFPKYASRPLLGLAIAGGVLLTASLVRRMLYVKQAPRVAARFSLVFFSSVLVLLWVAIRTGLLNGLTVFLIAAAGWILGGLTLTKKLPARTALGSFRALYPNHWADHWKYARWVLPTAFVFQFTTQGYYWVVAGLLSLKEVAQLRVVYLLVMPIEQVLTAITLVILPTMAFHIASKRIPEFLLFWKKYLGATVAITGVFAVCVCLVSRRILHTVYGGKFDEVAPLLGILSVLPILMGVANTMNAALKAMEKPQWVFYAYVSGGLATVLLGIPLVMRYKLLGAVLGMLVSALAYGTTMAAGFRTSWRRISGRELTPVEQDWLFKTPEVLPRR
jgi:O-antigen/teichoic acid export membrane protein